MCHQLRTKMYFVLLIFILKFLYVILLNFFCDYTVQLRHSQRTHTYPMNTSTQTLPLRASSTIHLNGIGFSPPPRILNAPWPTYKRKQSSTDQYIISSLSYLTRKIEKCISLMMMPWFSWPIFLEKRWTYWLHASE